MDYLTIESRIAPILDNVVSIIKEHETRSEHDLSQNKKSVEEKDHTINLLNEKIERQKEEMDDFLKVSFASKWKKQCEELEGTKSRLEDKLDDLQRINVELNHRLDQMSKQDTVETQTETVEGQVCDDSETQELKKKNEKLEKTNKTTQKKNRELTKKVEELHRDLDTLTTEYGKNNSAIESLSNVENERDELMSEVEKLTSKLNELETSQVGNDDKKECQNKIDDLNKQLDENIETISSLKNQVVTFEKKLSQMETVQMENSELNQKVVVCEGSLSQIKDLQNENKTLTEKLATYEEKGEEVQEQVDTSVFEEKITKLEAINATNYDKINELEIELGNKQCEMIIKTAKGAVYTLKDKELIKDGKVVGNVVETKLA